MCDFVCVTRRKHSRRQCVDTTSLQTFDHQLLFANMVEVTVQCAQLRGGISRSQENWGVVFEIFEWCSLGYFYNL